MKFTNLISVLMLLVLTGCASSPMTVALEQELPLVQSDEAQIVFMRTSHFGGAISASLFNVTDSETDYIGVIAVGTKIAVKTTPGEKMFMVVSEAADFMEATLEAGKTYYAMVTPRIGAWTARFSLWPMSSDSTAKFKNFGPAFDKAVSDTELLAQSEKSLAWFEKHKTDIEKKKAKYLPVWNEKTDEAMQLRSLKLSDGL